MKSPVLGGRVISVGLKSVKALLDMSPMSQKLMPVWFSAVLPSLVLHLALNIPCENAWRYHSGHCLYQQMRLLGGKNRVKLNALGLRTVLWIRNLEMITKLNETERKTWSMLIWSCLLIPHSKNCQQEDIYMVHSVRSWVQNHLGSCASCQNSWEPLGKFFVLRLCKIWVQYALNENTYNVQRVNHPAKEEEIVAKYTGRGYCLRRPRKCVVLSNCWCLLWLMYYCLQSNIGYTLAHTA